jgi:hypothetical protein
MVRTFEEREAERELMWIWFVLAVIALIFFVIVRCWNGK